MVELEVSEFCVDLQALSQLVLNDFGATLQILRWVGREFGDAAERPNRIEDCIATMGVQTCIEVMSTQCIQTRKPSMALSELSSHSKEIAVQSAQIAELMFNIDPAQAYFVGLCHSIGSLPALLSGSANDDQRLDTVATGLAMAKDWALPDCVIDYFSDVQKSGGNSPWSEILRVAHQCPGDAESEGSSEAELLMSCAG